MTAAELSQMLRERLPADQWALLFEVPNGTGFARRVKRTADAIAMSLWPSRGLELHGFEMKVSRSDWQRELADPSKAESIQRFCDRWWVVVSDANIVHPGELPPTWGLLAPRGSKLVVKVDAPKLEAQPVDRLFLASLLRAAQDASPAKAQIAAAVDAERKLQLEIEERRRESVRLHAEHERDLLKKSIEAFERASGVKIDGWHGERIGAAVNLVLRVGPENVRRQFESLRTQAKVIFEGIDRELAAPPNSDTEAA